MNLWIRCATVLAMALAPSAMAKETTAFKKNKNMQKCEEKCSVLFKNPSIIALFTSQPSASKTTCVEMCMGNPSESTSQLPLAQMKYHVMDTYLWGKAKQDPQKFQVLWNAFKVWMDNTYLKQCTGLKVINKDFVKKVKKSYTSKKGKIVCFGDLKQTYNSVTGTVGVLK